MTWSILLCLDEDTVDVKGPAGDVIYKGKGVVMYKGKETKPAKRIGLIR